MFQRLTPIISRSAICLIVAVFGLSSSVRAQEGEKGSGTKNPTATKLTELERVQEISKLTGRPIFAVAGQST